MDKPLLTFTIAAFNQEAFIREAVAAAFAQTYSPLEIVLSDDCSRDRTFEIMQEMASGYRGPHRLILNRNSSQQSIGGHVNRVVELSQGELIVGAAGDDISSPERTQMAYEAWEQSGRKATSIYSDYLQIDEKGNQIGKVLEPEIADSGAVITEHKVDPLSYLTNLEPIVFGCAHTFSRELFRVFGGLPGHIIHEDNALAFRSVLIGKLVHIKRPLVKYRVHGNNIYVQSRRRTTDLKTIQRQEEWLKRNLANREAMYAGFLADLECARRNGLINRLNFDQGCAIAARKRFLFARQKQFLSSGLLGKCGLLVDLWRREGLGQKEKKMLIRRLLPQFLLVWFRLASGYGVVAWQRAFGSKAAQPLGSL
jgi:glycosyltransferase involved in cell wall biosynthesis